MVSIYRIQFKDTFVEFELIDNEITRLWEESLNQGYELNLKHTIGILPLFSSHLHPKQNSSDELLDSYISEINNAIDGVNSSISGKLFPYRAFAGMGYTQTNRLHRCFTTGKTSFNTFQAQIPEKILEQYKKGELNYKNTYDLLNEYSPDDFEVIDRELFEENIHKINKYVHLYEDSVHSIRGKRFLDNHYVKPIVEISWDQFTKSGQSLHPSNLKIDPAVLKENFISNFYEYDIFLGKAITGKDYETCFTQYDDPLEWDITNAEFINGNLRIWNKTQLELYKDNQAVLSSGFVEWVKDRDIPPYSYTPVPLGKIVNSTESDFNIEISNTIKTSNEGPKAIGNFSEISITKLS